MFDFFGQALAWIELIGNFILSLVESTFMAMEMLVLCATVPYTVGALLPGLLGAAVLITLSVFTIRFIALK